jgi:CBS domain-containing protein
MGTIEGIMTKQVITIRKDATILEAAKLMDKKGIGSLVITEDSKPVGIITEKDFLKRVIAQERDVNSRVEEIMSAPLITIGKDVGYCEAGEVMAKKKIRRLPVIQEEELIGIITMRDMLPKCVDDLLETIDRISSILKRLG